MIYFFPFARIIIKITVSGNACGNQRDNSSAFAQDAEHCADGVAIPAFLKRYRATHNAKRAHEIFKLFVYVADFVRHLAAFHMIIPQNFVNGVLCDGAVIVQGGFDFSARDGGCHIRKRFGKCLVVVMLAISYLFVKPTHIAPPPLLV